MKIAKSLIIITLILATSFNMSAQNSDVEAVENEKLFTSKDKDFIQLWYHEQILKMDLDQVGRDDYASLLLYYTYKMGRLKLAKYNYTDSEMKERFDDLVDRLNVEMKENLSDKNYGIHLDSFKAIENVVYEKKKWEK